MMHSQDKRFEELLFYKIGEVTPQSKYMINIHFTRMNKLIPEIHKWSRNKNKERNCYGKIKPNHCYIISQRQIIYKTRPQWVWTNCTEVTEHQLSVAYKVWNKVEGDEEERFLEMMYAIGKKQRPGTPVNPPGWKDITHLFTF